MKRLALIFLVAAAPAVTADLLQNPGFETRLGDAPADWYMYVEPQEGAVAEWNDAEFLEGRKSVMLRNELPYPNEPANNWSQNVLDDLSGKAVVLRGSIKTEDATEAALWIQCFRKNPWKVMLQKSTSETVPVSGTLPWTPVEMETTVPDDTDFVVIRCVLKGTGAAWFDEISLETREVKSPPVRAIEKPVAAPLAPNTPVVPKVPDMPQAAPPSTNATRDEILDAHEAIRDANEALRQSNQALAEQIQAMRDQLEALRQQIREAGENVTTEKEAVPQAPVPPLVPRIPESEKEETP
jgi:hypothetical protein